MSVGTPERQELLVEQDGAVLTVTFNRPVQRIANVIALR
jgi:hypothetical protein